MKIINGIMRFVKWIFNIGTPNSVAISTPEQIFDNERDILRLERDRDAGQVIENLRRVEELNAQLAESIRIVEEANNVISIEHVQAPAQQQFRREFNLNEIQRDGDIRLMREIERSVNYVPQDNTLEYVDVMQNDRVIERIAVPSPIQSLRSLRSLRLDNITAPQFQVPNMIMGRISPNPQPSITAEQMQIRFEYNPQNSMDSLSPPAKQGDPEEPLGLSIYQQSIENEKISLTNSHYDSDNITV